MVAPLSRRATLEDLLARDNADRLEIIDGELVEKAAPSWAHGLAENNLAVALGPFKGHPGSGGLGSWRLLSAIHVGYPSGEIYCHDAAGWRRDRVPERPTEWPVRIMPDWVCEIISPKHERADLVVKPRVLHTAKVPHYWILDPNARILLVHRWSPDGYVVIQRASAGEIIRAEPFDALELRIAALFSDDD
jgi:Uma2 family endonuclease